MSQQLGPEVHTRQAGIIHEDGLTQLSQIQIPTLAIVGAQDALRSLDEAEELQRGIPGMGLTIIEGTGHMIPLEAPQRLADVLGSWPHMVT